MRILLLLFAVPLLGGCVVGTMASTAVDVVTLPVKAAGKTVDVLTTSQSEADEKRGRQIREREDCMGEELRRAERRGRDPDYSRCEH